MSCAKNEIATPAKQIAAPTKMVTIRSKVEVASAMPQKRKSVFSLSVCVQTRRKIANAVRNRMPKSIIIVFRRLAAASVQILLCHSMLLPSLV
ncbi:hypothetical protein D9M68_896900 [compost metagenome]